MQAPEPLSQLLSDNDLSLADWYGEPLDARQAEYWVRQLLASSARTRLRFRDRLAELVARYWSGRDAEMSYYSLLAIAQNDIERALLELCYGQLLLARKRQPARKHLDAGFALAAHLWPADDYFRVMKRHQALAVLPLSTKTAAPSGLEALLKEACVIDRLTGTARHHDHAEGEHCDTLD
ncbi:hypothetical protein DFR30_0021 [Thiogranum longum]|uniref:Uncharacterized protein n=1 Tax=Thiogranum longum TaxID=1537524 RepID=A0A4R1HHX4_9GAMM|nr:hypothetical protein DFR30_0021 [Thiogranum longum]